MGASKVFSFFTVLEPPLTWYQCYCIFLWTQHYHNYSTKIIMLQYYWNHHQPKERKQPAITRKRDWLCLAQHCAIPLRSNMISKLEILFRCDKRSHLGWHDGTLIGHHNYITEQSHGSFTWWIKSVTYRYVTINYVKSSFMTLYLHKKHLQDGSLV